LDQDESFVYFLENFGLYRNCKIDSMSKLFPPSAEKPPLALFCKKCKKDERKFKCYKYTVEPILAEMPSMLAYIGYKCVECETQVVNYILYINHDKNYLMKVGQWPSWLPIIGKDFEKILGDNLNIYKKGLYCENEGCGIGAFAYYRRVVENTIYGLLDDLAEAIKADDTLSADNKAKYSAVYKKVKEAQNATDKIEIAIEMVPQELIECVGTNPLKILHSTLSIGLHSEPDEKCLQSAVNMRTALNHIIKGISEKKNRTRKEEGKYSDALKKLEKDFIQSSSKR